MKEKRFEIMLPEEVIAGFGWAEHEVPARVREVLVMELLRRHAISQRKAAELLHLNLRDLFEVMGQYKVPTIDLTSEEVDATKYANVPPGHWRTGNSNRREVSVMILHRTTWG